MIDRGILDVKKIQKCERKKTQEEKDIINAMKVFARFNTKEEHERLVQSLIKERQLREVIEQLKFFRAKGLQTLDECERFIEHLKKKDVNADFQKAAEFARNPTELLRGHETYKMESAHSREHTMTPSMKILYQQAQLLPGFDRLSTKEKELVAVQQLDPLLFLTLKNEIKVESALNKKYDAAAIREIGRRTFADQG